jgi:hypothetical protein
MLLHRKADETDAARQWRFASGSVK